jgi:hypothetical protein
MFAWHILCGSIIGRRVSLARVAMAVLALPLNYNKAIKHEISKVRLIRFHRTVEALVNLNV